ncbi:FAD-binding oxidoreductase [Kitasatospora sp. NPDC096147]|uniref:FAD-binding oxidoreductase n=1 Tax=Kitasatospora sp. NPDC096147 TaxID=3364093 RepID=UPI003825B157
MTAPSRRTLLTLGLGAALPSSAPRAAATAGPDWTGLATALRGELLRPAAPGYDAARLPRNLRFADAARPEAVARCADAADVAECLRFSRRHGLRPAVRSGGHCYGGWSSDAPLVIDLAALDSVRVTEGQAELGPGTPLMTVYAALARHGVTIPAGSCPTVGLAGLALGGGHGVTSRAYGLTCDSLLSAEVVLADGRTVRCDPDHEPELFWALRGGGNGNFGIVTSLRLRTHPAPDCTVFQYSWDWPEAGRALAEWQRWAYAAPDRLWSNFHVWTRPDGPSVDAGGILLGPAEELRQLTAPLLARTGRTTSERVVTRPYLDTMLAYAGCSTDPTPAGPTPADGDPADRIPTARECLDQERRAFAAASHFFDDFLPDRALTELRRFAERRDSVEASISFTALGGAVNRVPAADTAFRHRSSVLLAQLIAEWPADADPAPRLRWVADARTALAPYANGHAYQNYRDPTLTDWRIAYYGEHLPRLRAVKAAYDPDRTFDFPQAV